jgi:hypothetical protein
MTHFNLLFTTLFKTTNSYEFIKPSKRRQRREGVQELQGFPW